MSLTREESALLGKRDTELNVVERNYVEGIMNELNHSARVIGLPIRTDDRQCRVEAALIRLVLESRP